jgi:hypothetical protein
MTVLLSRSGRPHLGARQKLKPTHWGKKMKRFLRFAALLVLVAPLAAACGGGEARGPDRTEGRIDEAKLREFIPFFPAAPDGYTRSEQPGVYSADDGSTISYMYTNGPKMFSIVIGFSNARVSEDEEMMGDESKRNMFGFDLTTVAGHQALSAKQRNSSRSDFLVVVSNSRSVSIMPSSSDLPDKALVQQVFEKIDFMAIANK